jgi:hypothetical protein
MNPGPDPVVTWKSSGQPGTDKTGQNSGSFDKSPVQLLNEMLARLGMAAATYGVTEVSGTPDNRTFVMKVTLLGHTYSGTGKSKKRAKTATAETAVNAAAEWYEPHRLKRGKKGDSEEPVGEKEDEEAGEEDNGEEVVVLNG